MITPLAQQVGKVEGSKYSHLSGEDFGPASRGESRKVAGLEESYLHLEWSTDAKGRN